MVFIFDDANWNSIRSVSFPDGMTDFKNLGADDGDVCFILFSDSNKHESICTSSAGSFCKANANRRLRPNPFTVSKTNPRKKLLISVI